MEQGWIKKMQEGDVLRHSLAESADKFDDEKSDCARGGNPFTGNSSDFQRRDSGIRVCCGPLRRLWRFWQIWGNENRREKLKGFPEIARGEFRKRIKTKHHPTWEKSPKSVEGKVKNISREILGTSLPRLLLRESRRKERKTKTETRNGRELPVENVRRRALLRREIRASRRLI